MLLGALAAAAPSPTAHAHAWANEYECDDGVDALSNDHISAMNQVRPYLVSLSSPYLASYLGPF